MASLAELMFQQASQNIRDTKSDPSAIARAYQNGARLAQKRQQLEMAQQSNLQAQQAAKLKGVEQVLNMYKNADKFKNEADARAYLKAVPNTVEAYQVGDVFTPELQNIMQGSREARQAAFMIESKVKAGEMSASEGMQYLSMAGIPDAVEMKRLADAEEFALSERGKAARSKDQIEAARVKQQAAFEQFPVKEKQRKIISAVTDFQEKGGFARTDRNIKVAENVLDKLESGELKTGTPKLKGLLNVPFTDQMNVLRTLDSDLALAVDEMQSAVNVKGALDSQFSDAMAIRVFSRVIDPLASNEANIARIKDFIETTKREKAEKRKLVDQYGGLGGPALEEPRAVREGDNLGITEKEMPRLKSTYQSLISGGSSPREAFGLLKDYLIKNKDPNITDEQINNIIRSFQLENRGE